MTTTIVSRLEADVRIRKCAEEYRQTLGMGHEEPIEMVLAALSLSLGVTVPEHPFDEIVLALSDLNAAELGDHPAIIRNRALTVDNTADVIARCHQELTCRVNELLDTLHFPGQWIIPGAAA